MTILSLWTASQAAAAANSKLASPAPSLCQISEELFGSKSGPDKKAAALSFAQAAVGATDAVANKNIVDGSKFQDGLGKVIDGVVACLNASVWAGKRVLDACSLVRVAARIVRGAGPSLRRET